MRLRCKWVALAMVFALVLGPTAPAAAQDALRGKRYYMDTARMTGASVSCVDCHRGLPPGLFGIGSAANSPDIIANALNTIPQMAPLRGRLATADIVDLAAYIGSPGVPSPTLRVSTRNPGGSESSDRLEFGSVLSGQSSGRGTVRLQNEGALPLQLTGNVRLVGPQAAEYFVVDSECVAAPLGTGQSCEIGIVFRPTSGGTGLRSAAAQVGHDWVGGTAAVALLGTSEPSAANPPVATSGGGGGALGGGLLLAVAGLAALRTRRALAG